MLMQPVLDTAAGLHDLELGGDVGDAALDDLVEVHHGCLADELPSNLTEFL
jgi:hypothetical protein